MSSKPPSASEETFHKARSRLIDAFARLEGRVVLALEANGQPVKSDTLATKLKTLRSLPHTKIKNSPNYDTLTQLIQFRADLVHGTMEFVVIDDERMACFRNARTVVHKVQSASLIAYKSFQSMADEIDKLSSDLIPA